MLKINIKGATRSQKKHLTSFIHFCHRKLMPRMKYLEINIQVKKFLDDEYTGFCFPTYYADNYKPREFVIEINRFLRLRDFLETIAHEMVHVKQFARGELYQSLKNHRHKWLGEWFKKDPEYWDRPWEIEAHGRELGLFLRWVDENDLSAKLWTKIR